MPSCISRSEGVISRMDSLYQNGLGTRQDLSLQLSCKRPSKRGSTD